MAWEPPGNYVSDIDGLPHLFEYVWPGQEHPPCEDEHFVVRLTPVVVVEATSVADPDGGEVEAVKIKPVGEPKFVIQRNPAVDGG